MFKRLSIRQKQMAIIMATSSVALLMAGAGFVLYEVLSFRQAMTTSLSSLASVIGNNCTAALDFEVPKEAKEVLSSLSKEPNVVAACVFDNRGRVFESYTRPDATGFKFPNPILTDSHEFSNNRLEVFQRIETRKDGRRVGTIYICSDATELWIRLRQYTVIVAVVLCASIVVALMLSLSLQRLISEPILRLAKMAKVVSTDKNYALRAPSHGTDEIGTLVTGFNEMLEQIQARDAALESARQTLEQRVQERTHELQQEVAERSRAELGLTEQLKRINLLNSITRAIMDRQDLASIILVVLRKLQDHLHVPLCRLYFYDTTSKHLSLAGRGVRTGDAAEPIDLFLCASEIEQTGLAQCQQGQIVRLERSASAVTSKLQEAGLESGLAVPLIVENGLVGILLTARKEANGFNVEETEFLKI